MSPKQRAPRSLGSGAVRSTGEHSRGRMPVCRILPRSLMPLGSPHPPDLFSTTLAAYSTPSVLCVECCTMENRPLREAGKRGATQGESRAADAERCGAGERARCGGRADARLQSRISAL